MRQPGYLEDLCWMNQDGECDFRNEQWLSLTFQFYGAPVNSETGKVDMAHEMWDCRMLSKEELDEKVSLMRYFYDETEATDGRHVSEHTRKAGKAVRFFSGDRGFKPLGDNGLRICDARSILPVGTPYKNFSSIADRWQEQKPLFQEASDSLQEYMRWKYYPAEERDPAIGSPYLKPIILDGGVDLLFLSNGLRPLETERITAGDLSFAGMSGAFVFVLFIIHSRSGIMGIVGMIAILFAFPASMVILYYLFGVTYVNELFALAFFLILGIGADDIFVLMDAFKHAKHVVRVDEKGFELKQMHRRQVTWHSAYKHLFDRKIEKARNRIVGKRLAHALNHSIQALFITSATTAVAFVGALSPITPMRAFSVFSATTIVVLFFHALLLGSSAIAFVAVYRATLGKWGSYVAHTEQTVLRRGEVDVDVIDVRRGFERASMAIVSAARNSMWTGGSHGAQRSSPSNTSPPVEDRNSHNNDRDSGHRRGQFSRFAMPRLTFAFGRFAPAGSNSASQERTDRSESGENFVTRDRGCSDTSMNEPLGSRETKEVLGSRDTFNGGELNCTPYIDPYANEACLAAGASLQRPLPERDPRTDKGQESLTRCAKSFRLMVSANKVHPRKTTRTTRAKNR